MRRRIFLGLLSLACWAAWSADSGLTAAPAKSKTDALFNACKACEKDCLDCFESCLGHVAGGHEAHLECLKLCQDCASICATCAEISGRGGPLETTIATACAEACEKCAVECEKHTDDESCVACAKECRKCLKVCQAHLKAASAAK
jgi:hypothetical protein